MRAARRSPPTTPACARSSTTARPGCWSAAATRRGRRGARRARRAGPERRARDGRARAGRRRSREWSWPRLLDRMDGAYAEAIEARAAKRAVVSDAPRRRLLLVAYFYPPCRDTGVLRPAAMAKWLRRARPRGHGADHVRLRRARRRRAAEDVDAHAPTRSAGAPGCAGKDTVGAMFDSPTYSGRPHPLSRVLRPRGAGRRLGAVRALARAAAAARAPLRLRDHDARRPSPPTPSGCALHRRGVPWVADIRDAWTFEPLRPRVPDRARSAASTRGSSAAGSAPPTRSSASPSRRPPTCASAGSPRRCSFPTAGTPRRRRRPPRRPACSTPSGVSIVYTGRFGSYGRDPRPLVEAARPSSPAADPEAAGEARARDRRAAHRRRGGAGRRRRRTGADRPRRQPRARAGAGAAARGRCAPAGRPADRAPSCSTSSCSSTSRAARRSSRSPPAPRRAGRRRARGRGRRRRRPGGDRGGARQGRRRRARRTRPPTPSTAYTYPAPAGRWRARSRQRSRRTRRESPAAFSRRPERRSRRRSPAPSTAPGSR